MLLNVQLFYIFDQISEQWGFKKKPLEKQGKQDLKTGVLV